MTRQQKQIKTSFVFSILFLPFVIFAAGNYLFKDAKTDWKIYLPLKATPVENYSAKELQESLKKISGADFEILQTDNIPSNKAIILGSLESSEAIKSKATALKLKKGSVEELAVYTLGGNLYLAGNNARGCLYAVYSFLQNQLSVRWLWPGKNGEFTPQKKSYLLPELAWNYKPSFRIREMTPCYYNRHKMTERWLARNFLNAGSLTKEIRDNAGFYRVYARHMIALDKKDIKSHPELAALINGKRTGKVGCWSNPDFLTYLVKKHSAWIKNDNLQTVNTFPSDTTMRCECETCNSDLDPTSRYFDLYYKLIQELKKKFPKLKYEAIAYQEYRNVPDKKVNGIDYVHYCQYNRCYVHKLNDKKCKLNQNSMIQLKEWQKKARMGIYGYEFDIFAPTMYVPFWNMLADEIKIYHKMGIERMKTEMFVNEKKGLPREKSKTERFRIPHYIYARLLWNSDLSIDELLADWCKTVYGPAYEPMLAYHKAMADAWDNMKIHRTYFFANPLGTSKYFLSKDLIQKAKNCFEKAEKLVANEKNKQTRQRIVNDIALDKKFFNDWENMHNMMKDSISVSLPLLKDKGSFKNAAELSFTSKKSQHKATKAFIYWTKDALHLKVECSDPNMAELRKGDSKDANNIWGCDNVEIFLDCNDGNNYRHFAVTPAGSTYSAEGNDVSWNPEWHTKTEINKDSWTVEITLPFSSLGVNVKPDDQWLMVLNRNSKPEACGFPMPSYHDVASGAVIYFAKEANKKRKMIWLMPKGCKEYYSSCIPALLKRNWEFKLVEDNQVINEDLAAYNLIVLSLFLGNKSLCVDKEFYEKIGKVISENGAALLISDYGKRYNEKKLFSGNQDFYLSASSKIDPYRKTTSVANSTFVSQPDDIKKILLSHRTPPQVYIPNNPERWEFMASQYMKDSKTEQPYLLACKYGKGMVCIASVIHYSRNPSQIVSLFNNILDYSLKTR